jgi:hypothetical protein
MIADINSFSARQRDSFRRRAAATDNMTLAVPGTGMARDDGIIQPAK